MRVSDPPLNILLGCGSLDFRDRWPAATGVPQLASGCTLLVGFVFACKRTCSWWKALRASFHMTAECALEGEADVTVSIRRRRRGLTPIRPVYNRETLAYPG